MRTLEKILQEIEDIKKLYIENGFSLIDKGNLPCEYDKSDIESAKVKALSEAIEIIKKHLSYDDKWIPVDPNNIPDREVLCCDEYGEQLIGYLSNTEEGWICESGECTMYYVVGWMEKPKPCRKDGEKN